MDESLRKLRAAGFRASLVDSCWLAVVNMGGIVNMAGFTLALKAAGITEMWGMTARDTAGDTKFGVFLPNVSPKAAQQFITLTEPDMLMTRNYFVQGRVQFKVANIRVRVLDQAHSANPRTFTVCRVNNAEGIDKAIARVFGDDGIPDGGTWGRLITGDANDEQIKSFFTEAAKADALDMLEIDFDLHPIVGG